MNSLIARGHSGASISRAGAPAKHAQASRRTVVVTRASREGDSFLAGFVLGGVVFGTLGFVFAPQISKSLLDEETKSLRLPKFMAEEKDPEQTKQELFDKIAQLNASIDDVAASLKTKEVKETA